MDQLMYFAALRGVSASEAKKRIHYWAERFDIIEYLYEGCELKNPLGMVWSKADFPVEI